MVHPLDRKRFLAACQSLVAQGGTAIVFHTYPGTGWSGDGWGVAQLDLPLVVAPARVIEVRFPPHKVDAIARIEYSTSTGGFEEIRALGYIITAALENAGVRWSWDGDPYRVIEVLPESDVLVLAAFEEGNAAAAPARQEGQGD